MRDKVLNNINMVTETILATTATHLVKTIIESLVKPKLQNIKKKYNEVMIPKAEHFQEYLERTYDKYSIINTLVFHNSQRQLKDIYVDQTLVKEIRFEEEEEETTKIDRLPVELIRKYKKILITDTAGMGKSTILKRMFIDLIDNNIKDIGIPIYIELNKLNNTHTILDEIKEELNSLSEEFDNNILLKFIQTGGFIFFLDGFDEISIKDRNEVTINIKNFISKAGPKNYYILTSRPESGLLDSFGDFQSFNIKPLKKDEAFELLRKYDMSRKKIISEKLIELLKSGQYNTIDEYLVNPLLVSLLYTAYDYNRSIPFEKHRFYGLVFEAYFEKHDSSKPIRSRDKLSGLNLDGFDSILRYIGYKCLKRVGVKFSEDNILNTIREAKDFCGNFNFSESNLLKDLVSSVPLFCKEGSYYKWAHKSLLEYFAARFIYCDTKQKQELFLTSIYNDDDIDKYSNMLDLYYDIDYKGFSKSIMLPFLEEYVEYHDKHYPKEPILSTDIIEARIGLFYPYYEVGIIREKYYYTNNKQRDFSKSVFQYINNKNSELRGENKQHAWYAACGQYDAFVSLACCKSRKYVTLSKLIQNKKSKLFSDYKCEPTKIDKNFFSKNKFYSITEVMSEIENKDLFCLINCLLLNSNSYYLNYDNVKEEINILKKEIDCSNNTLNSLAEL